MSPTLALIHSPLLGPASWQQVAAVLRSRDLIVVVPDLTGVLAEDPPYYRRFADAAGQALHGQGERPLVLVGHSGAGALLPAIAEAVGTAVGALFVDALLPAPGASWFDDAPSQLREQVLTMATQGRLPPWHQWFPHQIIVDLLPDDATRAAIIGELPAVPVDYFAEQAPPAPHWPVRHCGYLLLSEAYETQFAEAKRLGWPAVGEPSDHLALVTRPEQVADRLQELLMGLRL